MTVGPADQSSIVAARVVVPDIDADLVLRPRLDDELARLLTSHRVVGVFATAGSGKTTTVAQAVRRMDSRCAWLTLDPADSAPGRLLVYLEAALRRSYRELAPRASETLMNGASHREAGGLLAQALPPEPMILVIDELERIADHEAALDVLSGFIRYLPATSRVVLVGRREVELDALARLGYDAIGRLGEDQLSFDVAEAAQALARQGVEADPRSVVEATGGWVTGVLFEAWRSRDHVGGSGGEADPLAGYLAAEILDGISAREREFLIRTSLLDEVTPSRARAIGETDAEAVLDSLRLAHLPATRTSSEGRAFRAHPRFREYLRSLLARRDPEDISELRLRFGRALVAEGRDEEAVVELLSAGWLADAVVPAERVLGAIVRRLDLALAQSWLDQFASGGLLVSPGLWRAQLTVAIAREEFRQAVEAADQLRRSGELPGSDPETLELAVLAAWGYWHVGRLDDVRALVDAIPSGHQRDVVRYLCSSVDPEPPDTIPQPAGGPLDALILRIGYVRGRLVEVRDAPVSDWTGAATERISAWRAIGDLERTRSFLVSGGSTLPNLRYQAIVEPELLIDLAHEEHAREALLRGRARIVGSGSFVFDVLSRLLAAKLELRLRRNADAALTVLAGIEGLRDVRAYGYLAEQIDTWRGFALLIAGEDSLAVIALRQAVESMVRADRILELPTAAVYLSEAEWRLGEVADSDAAAQVALTASARQGSRHILLNALEDFPAVLARQLDGESEIDGPWHEISRAFAAARRRGPVPLDPTVRIRDIGPPALYVGGEERRLRTAKSYALLGYLRESGGRVAREQLYDVLFDGKRDDSTRAYLRQVVHNLRGQLPASMELLRDGEFIVLGGYPSVETDSMVLEARTATAMALTGGARLGPLLEIVKEYGQGQFLDGVDCAWVEARRLEIAERLTDIRLEAAVAAFDESQFELASRLLDETLSDDPFRERAWRISMRVAAAQGLDDRVIDTYRRYERAFAEAGIEPSDSTRRLFAGLRR